MPHIHRTRAASCRGRSITRGLVLAIGLATLVHSAIAQEAEIRKALVARLPPSVVVDAVTPSPIEGLYEVRSGTSVFYADRHGDYVVRGEMIDTRTQMNLTEARIAKLSNLAFASLPIQDSVVSLHGRGTRKLAVFADPECPYCKQLEAMLRGRDDVTVYTFLMPILGPGSVEKAKAIWCAEDRSVAWDAWMREGKLPAAQPDCDTSALDRNMALRDKHSIRGTPTLVFENGKRTSGALGALQLERELAEIGSVHKQ
jgi:thiol:disulfide interchange protein DsbC